MESERNPKKGHEPRRSPKNQEMVRAQFIKKMEDLNPKGPGVPVHTCNPVTLEAEFYSNLVYNGKFVSRSHTLFEVNEWELGKMVLICNPSTWMMRQDEFKVILTCIESSRSTWATWIPMSNKTQIKRMSAWRKDSLVGVACWCWA